MTASNHSLLPDFTSFEAKLLAISRTVFPAVARMGLLRGIVPLLQMVLPISTSSGRTYPCLVERGMANPALERRAGQSISTATQNKPFALVHRSAATSKREGKEGTTLVNEQAFTQVYLTYRGLIYHRLSQMIGQRDLAEDLTQEVFLRAWKALPGMQAPLQMQAWLCRIATNLAIDTLRRRRRINWTSLDEAEEEPEDAQDPDPQLAYSDQRELIGLALTRLPVSYRAALLLRAQGYALAEIAARLGIAPGGIKMHLARARQCFQQHYQELQTLSDMPSEKEREENERVDRVALAPLATWS